MVESDASCSFQVGRGTKQGDPLSTLLFNAVLENAFRDVRSNWLDEKFGLEMSIRSECRVASLCLADDVLLVASSAKPFKEMLSYVTKAAARRGLSLHENNTKVITNGDVTASSRLPAQMDINSKSFKVVGQR